MPNKFQKMTEPNSDLVTVRIWDGGDGVRADVQGPTRGRGGLITTDIAGQDGSLSVPQALNVAIQLAEKHGVRIAVIDENDLWHPEWGMLTEAT